MKTLDVVGICNALVDILIQGEEQDITRLKLNKGVMHLVDAGKQNELLAHFADRTQTVELGGSTMNAVRTLAQLGKRTAFAGMVADDAFGERIKRRMDELGILAHLGGHTEEKTGTCVILVTPDGERTMITHLGASRLYGSSQVPHDDIARSKVLHFCGYQWDTDGQMQAIAQAIATAKEYGTLVSFDVADPFVVSRHRQAFLELIARDSDIVFANREEAQMLYGTTAEEAARQIAQTGATAVIKLGGDGALVQKGDSAHHIAPVKTQVVDTTAAGDMFAAGFLFGYTSDRPLPICGHMAATVASDVISRIGASVSGEALARVATM